MARPRTPTAKAEVAGANLVHPERFRDRKKPAKSRPVGEPYATMNDNQRAAWVEFQHELPWLTSAHRPLLRLACIWTAKMEDADFGVSATKALSAILSKLGATPVDESKVNHGDSEDEDPSDKFFGKPH